MVNAAADAEPLTRRHGADDAIVELEPLESLLQAVAVNASNTAPPTITRNLF